MLSEAFGTDRTRLLMNVGAAQSPDSALAIISAILVIVGHQHRHYGSLSRRWWPRPGGAHRFRPPLIRSFNALDKAAEDARFRTIDMPHILGAGVQVPASQFRHLVVPLFVSADMVSNMLNAIRNLSPAACKSPVVLLWWWATP